MYLHARFFFEKLIESLSTQSILIFLNFENNMFLLQFLKDALINKWLVTLHIFFQLDLRQRNVV